MFTSRTEIYREVAQELRSEILYDPDNILLFGRYTHEIAAYRAKRSWHHTLEMFFLLEEGTDYTIEVVRSDDESPLIELKACFYSACGRYAFWRLTNDQAPEAQYLLEAAHIPNSELSSLEFMTAPDLAQLERSELSTGQPSPAQLESEPNWLSPIRRILEKLSD